MAAGTIVFTTLSPGLIPNPPGLDTKRLGPGNGVVVLCQTKLKSSLVPYISGMNVLLLCGVVIGLTI